MLLILFRLVFQRCVWSCFLWIFVPVFLSHTPFIFSVASDNAEQEGNAPIVMKGPLPIAEQELEQQEKWALPVYLFVWAKAICQEYQPVELDLEAGGPVQFFQFN